MPERDVEPLLDFLKQTRGFDLSGYKRTSLERRIKHRLDEVKVGSYAEYMDFLQVHPGEFPFLFDTILINVTSFFRDAGVWDHIGSEIVPQLAARKPEGEPIRVWCAACASGEEAYTAAMVLAEAFGIDQYRARVKIYGTDIDEGALTLARHGLYDARQVEPVAPELRERYFEQTHAKFVFRADLRRTVVFGRNDLLRDAPISRVDLVICRNALIYFTAEAQARILERLNFALQPEGVLVVGRSEMLINQNEFFRPIDIKMRLFGKVPRCASAMRSSSSPTTMSPTLSGASGPLSRRGDRRRAGCADRRGRGWRAGVRQPAGALDLRADERGNRAAAPRPGDLVPACRATLVDRAGFR